MNESCCWIFVARVPAHHPPRNWVHRRTRLQWRRTEAPAHSFLLIPDSYSSDTSSRESNQGLSSPCFLRHPGGTQRLQRGLTLQSRHQLLPPPHPPPNCPILTNTATTPLLLLPMSLSSAAPLTSLASIWIKAPCFSSYKSR